MHTHPAFGIDMLAFLVKIDGSAFVSCRLDLVWPLDAVGVQVCSHV